MGVDLRGELGVAEVDGFLEVFFVSFEERPVHLIGDLVDVVVVVDAGGWDELAVLFY